jgi:hypothetical protein
MAYNHLELVRYCNSIHITVLLQLQLLLYYAYYYTIIILKMLSSLYLYFITFMISRLFGCLLRILINNSKQEISPP